MSLSLSVEPTGHFAISVGGGALTLTGGEVRVNGLSSSKGSLVSHGGLQKVGGSDALGQWMGLRLSWAAATQKDILMHTTFITYPADPGLVVFEQSFPQSIEVTDAVSASSTNGSCFYAPAAFPAAAAENEESCAGKAASSTLFPAFDRSPGPTDSLPCFSYHGIFPQMRSCTFGASLLHGYSASHQGGVPLVVYNRTDSSLPMAVFSQLDWPKAQHVSTEPGVGEWRTAIASAISRKYPHTR